MVDGTTRQVASSTSGVLLKFAPFAVVSVIHLATLVIGWGEGSTITKLAVIPALLLGFILALPTRRGVIFIVGVIALLFSWLGDALLESPGDLGFILGLGSFMLAHVAYLVLFGLPMRRQQVPWPALIYAVWWFALVSVLAPHIGALLVPVSAYGLVIALAAAAALGTNRTAAVGAMLFLISDTLLAFRLFYPGFEFWQMNAVIMVFYIVGQGLIILGAVQHTRSSAQLNPASTTPLTPVS